MSLNEMSLLDVVKKQVQFKVNSYNGIFLSLIILQIFGLFVASLGESSMSESGYGRSTSTTYYGNGFLIGVTAMWVFISVLLMTTKAYKEDDFTFISTRWSRLLSNLSFTVILAALGTVTTYLLTHVLKVYLVLNDEKIIEVNTFSFLDLLTSLFLLFLFLFFIGLFGYTVGSIFQRNKVAALLVSATFIFIGSITIEANGEYVNSLIYFFSKETSVLLLVIKFGIVNSLLFFITWVVTENEEVRV